MKTIEKTFKRRDQIKHVPVLVRTEHAGVWFGTIHHKKGREIILKNAIRIWYWWAAKSISLSAVAIYGINQEKVELPPPFPGFGLRLLKFFLAMPLPLKASRNARMPRLVLRVQLMFYMDGEMVMVMMPGAFLADLEDVRLMKIMGVMGTGIQAKKENRELEPEAALTQVAVMGRANMNQGQSVYLSSNILEIIF